MADRSSANRAVTGPRQALVRFPTPGGRRWLAFEASTHMVVVHDLADVAAALDEIEAATARGQWAVGMISYDAAPAFDPALVTQRHPTAPLLAFAFFDDATPSRGPAGLPFSAGPWTPTTTPARHATQLARIHEHIAAGDTYQVNHTLRMRGAFSGDPLGLFEALSRAQRADHLAFLDMGDVLACSASPELLFHLENGRITTRPMKGTRPRHPVAAEDRRLVTELLRSEKDRAENTMIVDMMRNDVGRIADIGSLEVPALHAIETYPTVHQMTSTVTATTSASLAEILAALFPAASITGAPKVRTSEIIADLEDTPRGLYCGSIGTISPDGLAEFNVAIRTAWVDRVDGTVEYGIGGGIVWDSTADAEWDEAMDKARVLQRASSSMRLMESIAWHPDTGPTLVEQHLRRLSRGAEHFGFDVDTTEVRRVLDAVEGDESLKLRVLVAADGAIELESAPIGTLAPRPWDLPFDTEPVDRDDEFLYHKTTRRERYEAAAARFPDAPDVLLWNDRGDLTETTRGNVVVELDGILVTPTVESGLLAGTFRADLLDQDLMVERRVSFVDVQRCTAAYMINSVRGWVPLDVPALRARAAEMHQAFGVLT